MAASSKVRQLLHQIHGGARPLDPPPGNRAAPLPARAEFPHLRGENPEVGARIRGTGHPFKMHAQELGFLNCWHEPGESHPRRNLGQLLLRVHNRNAADDTPLRPRRREWNASRGVFNGHLLYLRWSPPRHRYHSEFPDGFDKPAEMRRQAARRLRNLQRQSKVILRQFMKGCRTSRKIDGCHIEVIYNEQPRVDRHSGGCATPGCGAVALARGARVRSAGRSRNAGAGMGLTEVLQGLEQQNRPPEFLIE
jgi:hypothetical protein